MRKGPHDFCFHYLQASAAGRIERWNNMAENIR